MKWPVKREQRQLFTKMIIAEQRLSNLAATGFYGYKTAKMVHDHYLWTNMYNRNSHRQNSEKSTFKLQFLKL